VSIVFLSEVRVKKTRKDNSRDEWVKIGMMLKSIELLERPVLGKLGEESNV
jgi:hypothetical protein